MESMKAQLSNHRKRKESKTFNFLDRGAVRGLPFRIGNDREGGWAWLGWSGHDDAVHRHDMSPREGQNLPGIKLQKLEPFIVH